MAKASAVVLMALLVAGLGLVACSLTEQEIPVIFLRSGLIQTRQGAG
jgi:hypothetical protein